MRRHFKAQQSSDSFPTIPAMIYNHSIDHVLSIRDISYEIIPNTAFHPILLEGAIPRIRADFQMISKFTSPNFQEKLDHCLATILKNPKLAHVWALIIEFRQEPIYVVRNLAHTNTTLLYRRVLLVNLDNYLLNQQSSTFMEH